MAVNRVLLISQSWIILSQQFQSTGLVNHFLCTSAWKYAYRICITTRRLMKSVMEDETSCAGGHHNMPPPPASWQYLLIYLPGGGAVPTCWLFKTSATSWPLTLKVVSESRVTWETSMPILVFLGLSVLDLGPMYATDVKCKSSLNAPPINNIVCSLNCHVYVLSHFHHSLIVSSHRKKSYHFSLSSF